MDALVIDLDLLADRLIAAAAASPEMRASESVNLEQATLRHRAIGFASGGVLPEHENPGEATLRVLRGRIRLSWSGQELEAQPGVLVRVPDAQHRVEALEPSVILLTAVPTAG